MALMTATEYKTATGDSTHTDAEINAALERYSALIEGYIQRALLVDDREDVAVNVSQDPLALATYPVEAITSITDRDGTTFDHSAFFVHLNNGLIYHGGVLNGRTITIQYSAGYEDLPEDVKAVLLTLTQGFLTGVSGGLSDLHSVKKETVMGVATIEYTGGFTTGSGMTAYAELGPFTTVLDRYRATSWA